MNILYEKKGDTAYFYLEGEIDHHHTADMRMAIDSKLYEKKPKKAVLDFGKISFTDSSGIALVVGRYNIMKEMGGTVEVQNVSSQVKKVFTLSGVDRLVKFY